MNASPSWFDEDEKNEPQMWFFRCPRCETKSYEIFSRYGYCHECDYVELKSRQCQRSIKRQKRKKNSEINTGKLDHLFNEDSSQPKNEFSDEDYEIVRKALLSIPQREQQIVLKSFWHRQKISEIAERMQMPEAEIEAILQSAYARLKQLCLKNPRFSRAFKEVVAGDAAA